MLIKEILAYLEAQAIPFCFQGNAENTISGFSALNQYKAETITWLRKQQDMPTVEERIRLLVMPMQGYSTAENTILCAEPRRIFFNILEHFFANPCPIQRIGQHCTLSPQVRLGENVSIGNNCTLEGDIVIGPNTTIWHNVTILNRVKIGTGCEIQSGVSIGHSGFGYEESEAAGKNMLPHYGGVQIGDRVLISANTVINRGTLEDTIIGSGTKIDAACFIAHNVQIGEDCALITGTRLYGSSVLERGCYCATALVKDHCTIGAGATLGMGAVVLQDIEPQAVAVGVPAKPIKRSKA